MFNHPSPLPPRDRAELRKWLEKRVEEMSRSIEGFPCTEFRIAKRVFEDVLRKLDELEAM